MIYYCVFSRINSDKSSADFAAPSLFALLAAELVAGFGGRMRCLPQNTGRNSV